jgi:hypothetical protein
MLKSNHGVALGLVIAGSAIAVARVDRPATAPKTLAVTRVTPHTPPDRVLSVALERLHLQALEAFYADPRNGLSRMPIVYKKVLRPWPAVTWTADDLQPERAASAGTDLQAIHRHGITDFLVPPTEATASAGLKKQNTSQEAAMSLLETDSVRLASFAQRRTINWEPKSVDLVGLLTHEQPVVYVSENLPAMEDLKKTPTRPLDAFETAGLGSLQKGETHYVRSRDGIVRMLGAVRAKSDCLACHETRQVGELLGAFSYTLREAKYERRPGY